MPYMRSEEGFMNPRLVMCMLVGCFAMWGGGIIAMKFAYQSFTGNQIVFARVVFAGILYLLLWNKWKNLPYKKGDWFYLVLMVAFEPCLFFLCETFSMKYTTAAQGGVIAACFPVCTAIAAWIVLGEKLARRVIIAIILAVAGVAISSAFAAGDDRAPNPLLGNILMLGAVFASSGYAITVRYLSQRYSFLAISAIQALGGTLVFMPLLFMDKMPDHITMPAVAGILYMGVGVGIIVYLIFNFSLKYLEAGVVSLFGNLIPVFTLFFAWILLNEQFNPVQLAGVCLTLTGVMIASTTRKA